MADEQNSNQEGGSSPMLRPSKKLPVPCAYCGQAFEAYPRDIELGRKYCGTSCSGAARKAPPVDRETLFHAYHKEQKSTNELAAQFSVSKGTIYNWLKALEIECREIGEGVSLAQTGIQHTPERRAAISRGHMGKPKAPEAVEKTRQALTGRKRPPLTDEHKAKIAEAKRGQTHTDATKAKLSAAMSARLTAGFVPAQKQGKARYKRGFREDIGIYVRSSWEANYCRYLQRLVERGEILRWEFEPQAFTFSGYSRGVVYYLPDFRLTYPDGRQEYVEVKGLETSKDRTKWKRLRAQYPNVRLRVVGKAEYQSLCREYGNLPHWER